MSSPHPLGWEKAGAEMLGLGEWAAFGAIQGENFGIRRIPHAPDPGSIPGCNNRSIGGQAGHYSTLAVKGMSEGVVCKPLTKSL